MSLFMLQKEFWSPERKRLEEYKVGGVYKADLARNGDYYLSKGSYFPFAYLLCLSVLWLTINAIIIVKRN